MFAIAAVAGLSAAPAMAGHVSIGVNIGVPGAYYAAPQPVYVQPAPVYVERDYYRRHRHWHRPPPPPYWHR
nr:hypothetical protein [Herbaspirillum sp. SJZ102]